MLFCSMQPLKWELKRQPGNFSPPRGGFKPDDPNQQIVAEDIFDEYGGKCPSLTTELCFSSYHIVVTDTFFLLFSFPQNSRVSGWG